VGSYLFKWVKRGKSFCRGAKAGGDLKRLYLYFCLDEGQDEEDPEM